MSSVESLLFGDFDTSNVESNEVKELEQFLAGNPAPTPVSNPMGTGPQPISFPGTPNNPKAALPLVAQSNQLNPANLAQGNRLANPGGVGSSNPNPAMGMPGGANPAGPGVAIPGGPAMSMPGVSNPNAAMGMSGAANPAGPGVANPSSNPFAQLTGTGTQRRSLQELITVLRKKLPPERQNLLDKAVKDFHDKKFDQEELVRQLQVLLGKEAAAPRRPVTSPSPANPSPIGTAGPTGSITPSPMSSVPNPVVNTTPKANPLAAIKTPIKSPAVGAPVAPTTPLTSSMLPGPMTASPSPMGNLPMGMGPMTPGASPAAPIQMPGQSPISPAPSNMAGNMTGNMASNMASNMNNSTMNARLASMKKVPVTPVQGTGVGTPMQGGMPNPMGAQNNPQFANKMMANKPTGPVFPPAAPNPSVPPAQPSSIALPTAVPSTPKKKVVPTPTANTKMLPPARPMGVTPGTPQVDPTKKEETKPVSLVQVKDLNDVSRMAGVDIHQEKLLPDAPEDTGLKYEKDDELSFLNNPILRKKVQEIASKRELSIGEGVFGLLINAAQDHLRDILGKLVKVAELKADARKHDFPIVSSDKKTEGAPVVAPVVPPPVANKPVQSREHLLQYYNQKNAQLKALHMKLSALAPQQRPPEEMKIYNHLRAQVQEAQVALQRPKETPAPTPAAKDNPGSYVMLKDVFLVHPEIVQKWDINKRKREERAELEKRRRTA